MERRVQQLVDEARAGGPQSLRAASRLMSMMTDQPQRMADLLACSHDWTQPQLVFGVTGSPGSGKSTLVDSVATEFRRRWSNRRLGIVAVDPSSPFTGGALLGDRVRMMRHATDKGVFIRSLATRGRLGGLALGVKGVVRVMGLIGCDVVIIETVGVGQSEIEIARHADLTAVVLAPGQGDSIQLLKAGLIEAGDLFIINKADREDAARLHQQLLSILQLEQKTRADASHGNGIPDTHHVHFKTHTNVTDRHVFLCSAMHGKGVSTLVSELESLTDKCCDEWHRRRRAQAAREIRQAVLREVERRVDVLIGLADATDNNIAAVLSGGATVDGVVDRLLREAALQSESHGEIHTLTKPPLGFRPFQLAGEGTQT